MNRRAFLTALGGSLLAAPLAAEAQHASRVRIGWLALARVPSDVATFRERLRALGWVEDENVSTEERYSEGKSERFPSLAADLVRAKVDVIVAIGTGVVAAAQQATASIPVVFVVGTDPVERGFVASFGRPGGNLTGIASLGNEMLNVKMLEVLRNAVPGITRVGVFHQPTLIQRQAMTVVGAGARALSVQLVPIEVRSAGDIDHAAATLAQERVHAFLVRSNPFFHSEKDRFVKLAATSQALPQPAISYNTAPTFRSPAAAPPSTWTGSSRAPSPADLPVEQPTKFELVINLKTPQGPRPHNLAVVPAARGTGDRVTTRRMFLSTVVGGLFSAPGVGGAQPAGRIARVGYLASVPRAESVAIQVFVAKLSEMGFIEGQNLVIEFRHGDSQVRLRALAAELIGLGVQVIHAANPYALQAAREVTTTVPIVGYDLESDPVAAGFAASLARPGGNITGVFLDQPEVSGKLLQFLTEMVPGLSRVAVLWDAPLASAQLKALEDAASRLRLMILPIVWHGPGELLRTLPISVKEGARGLVVLSSPRIHDRYLPFVADAALKHRLPSISLSSAFVRNGGLIAYGPVITDMRRAATALVVKILGGARPADLPIERPARFELTINPKTARALGLTIPQSLLLRADQVIE